ncbi:MAG: hypothetical protein SCH39_12280 [Methanosarcinales archaeon]|nr:hypothetical protein [Methanosarcinales archaeon]
MNKTTLKLRSDCTKKYTVFPFGDTHAQISLDFIAGVVIFMMTFIFLFQTLTNMFVPFQTNSDEVKSVSDRVTKTLVESTKGLASSQSDVNVISINRAEYINSLMDNASTYRTMQEEWGLYSSSNIYTINMSLYNTDGSLYLNGTGGVVLNNGPQVPQSTNVAQTIRVVYVDADDTIAILHVRVW